MKHFLGIVSQMFLAVSMTAQTIPFQTFDTAGVVLNESSSNAFSEITGTWSYPTSLGNPIFEPGTYFYTQYVAMDLLPNACPNFIQVGTNITLNSPDPSQDGTNGGYGFYVWNNITTNITDANGNLVQFLGGDTVTVTISVASSGLNPTVSFNSSTSGIIEFSLDGGPLCLEDVQWAIGSSPQEFMPDFEFAFFEDCSAIVTGGASVTLDGGSLVNLVILEDGIDNIQAEPEQVSGNSFRIEFQPDD